MRVACIQAKKPDEPAPHVTLSVADRAGRLAAIGTMRRDHSMRVAQANHQRITVIGAIADKILRLGFDQVEVEASCTKRTRDGCLGCAGPRVGNPWRSHRRGLVPFALRWQFPDTHLGP